MRRLGEQVLEQKIDDIDKYAQFMIGMSQGDDEIDEDDHTPNEFQQAVNIAQLWSDSELLTMGDVVNALSFAIKSEKNMNRKKQFVEAFRTFLAYSIGCYEDSCGIAYFKREE
jgi:hypothetical protein